MSDWALQFLRCVRCGRHPLREDSDGLGCPECGAQYPFDRQVGDFLDGPHPVVTSEIEAVASLDSSDPATLDRLRSLLRALDSDEAIEARDPRLIEFPTFLEVPASRRRTAEMLRRLSVAPGALVVELGADHCLNSGVLLDAGCRVVAIDITDHLHLAPRGQNDSLCRLRADMNRLPVRSGTADLVWATACVHHSWSLETTFREAHRVLRRGGRFVLVNEPMPAWPRHLAFGLGYRFGRRERRLGINETLHRRATWLATARRTGFEPRLVFPELDAEELTARLERRHLPVALGPTARRLATWLQVSIHMVAERSDDRA